MTPAATMPPGTKWPPAAFEGGEGREVVEGVPEALFVMAAVSSSVVVGSVVVDSSGELRASAYVHHRREHANESGNVSVLLHM